MQDLQIEGEKMNVVRTSQNIKKAKYVQGGEVISYRCYVYICTGYYNDEDGTMEFVDVVTGGRTYFDEDTLVELFPDATLCLNKLTGEYYEH